MAGLGKGLASIFGENYSENSSKEIISDGITKLRLSEIEPKKDQPRKYFNEESLKELAESIKKHGVLQPITVRKGAHGFYQIIAGERRWKAAKIAGLTEIPVIIKESDDFEASQLSIVENIQREDLNPYEEATGYMTLIKQFGLTQEEVANQVGKSRSAVANMLRLLDLPDDVIEMLKTGDISAGHARALLALKDKEMIIELAQKILIKSLSVRDTENIVKKLNKLYDKKGQNSEENADENSTDKVVVDYINDLERKARSLTGKIIKIKSNGPTKSVQIEYVDNEDLENILVKLCGKKILEEI